MTSPAKAARIDELMQKAEEALKAARWFEAERLAQRAFELGHQAGDFGRMARILLPLQESRRQRMQLAAEATSLKWVEGEISEDHRVTAGMHMLQPPHVGADARRIRLAAIRRETPVLVLCREPTTRLGLIPIVAIGLVTVRARIEPSEKPAKPTRKWFLWALEELGNAAIGMVDTGMDAVRQVDYAVALLDAVPEHEALHSTLRECCLRAEEEMRESASADAAKQSATALREKAQG